MLRLLHQKDLTDWTLIIRKQLAIFSSRNANAKVFAIMIPINQKMTCVYIEPDENMIEHMKQWMGMKMFVD